MSRSQITNVKSISSSYIFSRIFDAFSFFCIWTSYKFRQINTSASLIKSIRSRSIWALILHSDQYKYHLDCSAAKDSVSSHSIDHHQDQDHNHDHNHVKMSETLLTLVNQISIFLKTFTTVCEKNIFVVYTNLSAVAHLAIELF